ncbi:MAG: hypothetical protein IKV03_05500 [Alphaproteobacteria bacterium]|nr:hypothetical protein [Alphaproteobacteria bacterium]
MASPIKFTTSDLKDITEPLVQFATSLYTCDKLMSEIDDDFIRKQPHFFDVLVNDGISKKERKFNTKTDFVGGIDYSNTLLANAIRAGESFDEAQKNLAAQIQSGGYLHGDYKNFHSEFFPHHKQKAKNCRVVVTNNLIIKSNIKSNDTIMDFMRTNPECAKEMIRKTTLGMIFAISNPNCTQKQMNAFIVDQEKQGAIKHLMTLRHIPFIQATEKLRQFLFDTIINHHWQQVYTTQNDANQTPVFATTAEEAKNMLKKDKNKIFELAQNIGYIPDAQKMIKYQNARDYLSHPTLSLSNEVSLPKNAQPILNDFEDVLTHLTHGKKLKFGIVNQEDITNASPLVQQPLTVFADDISAYALIKDADMLTTLFKDYQIPKGANGKPLKPKKQLEALAALGIIAQTDIDALDTAIKNRNDFAHARLTPQSRSDAETNRIVTTDILYNVRNHHYNRFNR